LKIRFKPFSSYMNDSTEISSLSSSFNSIVFQRFGEFHTIEYHDLQTKDIVDKRNERGKNSKIWMKISCGSCICCFFGVGLYIDFGDIFRFLFTHNSVCSCYEALIN
jgi:hypothetical protein